MSNAFKRLRIGQVISTVVASGLFASAISAQSANGYDRALELASFDTAWVCAAATMVAAALLVVLGRRLLVVHRTARETAAPN